MKTVWTNLKRWGLAVLRRFNQATPVLVLLSMLFLLIAIWWLGPQWTWRERQPLGELAMRVSASVVVIVVPLLMWAWHVRERYQRWQAERQHEAAVQVDPCLAYIEAQERALDRSLGNLLNNMERRRSLYQLPWYLVLGEENAGKTSLITRSNQSFALSHMTRAGVRANQQEPLACPVDWWIGDEAVLIDPPGEFISHPDSPAENVEQQGQGKPVLPAGTHARLWSHLLDWLARNRSRRALNGVVLVVDVQALLAQRPEQRRDHANLLRIRLFELTRQLGTRLPVYVMLSKLDLLEGFEEFFARLSRSGRADLLGFTFSLDAVDDFDAWLLELIGQYQAFISCLSEHVFDDIGDSRTQIERDRLQALMQQMAGLRVALFCFLNEMLGSDRFTTPVLVRGVYFSSVLQQGTLSNAFIKEVGEAYQLPPPPPEVKPAGGTVIYFVQQLFQRVIYPESGLAGDNIKVARSKRRLLLAGFGVASLGCLVIIGTWQFYFDINRDKAASVLAKSQEFSERDIDAKLDPTGRNLLLPLDQIRDAVLVYGDYRQAWPLLSDMGLYQGRVIGPTVDEAYLNLLSKRFLPAIASGVLDAINAAPAGSNQQLAALRVYRMLEERQNRRAAIVEEWVARQWQRAYPGQGQLQADLMGHLGYALKYADADLPHYRERIAQVQQQLRQLPMAERVYMSLKQDAVERLHRPLDLRSEVGPAFDVVYRPLNGDQAGSGLQLPALLTAKGFKDYFEPGTEGIIELAMIDQWVLGERQRLDYSDEDRNVLTQRIRALYSADYVDSWRRVLNRFEVTDFDDLGHGVAVLEHVTGPAAPLRRLLETLRDNSVIYPAVPSAEGQASRALHKISDGEQQAAGIRRAFSSLAELITAQGEQPSYYEETLRSVSAVHDYAKAVHDNPDPGKAALKTVLNRFSLSGADPIANLQRVAVSLPEPLNQQVKKLADQTSQVLVIAALRELEKRWDSDIYSFYRERLAGRYPFKASGEDASLDDFEAFFGPQGRLQQFHDQYLNVFLKDNLDALYSDSLGGYLVRGDVLEQLKKVERIRDTFFNHRGQLAVQLTIEPLALSATRLSSMLSVDGQLIPYQHGAPQRTGLVWPNSLGNSNGSQLTLVHSTGNTASLSYRGPWSLFRLLSRGHLNGRTDTSVDLTFAVADGLMRYRIGVEKVNNPITQRSFEGFVLPRTLLEERRSKSAAGNVEGFAATAFSEGRTHP
ncbi:type VI secretion system membrane subunit TssM [Pseudomonas trivialis]|uniref:Type VI secretion protein VasK n=1 Tax=Pseudomonas trivialis TaxID=200450 RepID=A0A0R2ZJR1_9PSED|nr:type VI secretion system membrane subunit TssM [Pseudomonas trivialis]KRP58676.1 type VI secretion protein VasK [Pseudomonas trivialis]SDS73805.1 type VI secretion system protein ImpL [Pseudomonas trivialis]